MASFKVTFNMTGSKLRQLLLELTLYHENYTIRTINIKTNQLKIFLNLGSSFIIHTLPHAQNTYK